MSNILSLDYIGQQCILCTVYIKYYTLNILLLNASQYDAKKNYSDIFKTRGGQRWENVQGFFFKQKKS